jgi:hypothetical protein
VRRQPGVRRRAACSFVERAERAATVGGDTDRGMELDVARLMIELSERCDTAPEIDELPATWLGPMAELLKSLETVELEYRLQSVSRRANRLRIHPRLLQLPCCEQRSFEELDSHFEDANEEHRLAVEALEEKNEQIFALCERAVYSSPYWGEQRREIPNDTRPVVAFDVDGVLNVVPPAPLRTFEADGRRYAMIGSYIVEVRDDEVLPSVREGLTEARVHVPVGVCENPFFAGARRDIDVVVRVDPKVLAWVKSLHERAEVVWATTWEEAANLFADDVGLPRAVVGCDSTTHPPRFGYVKDGDSAAWKADALREVFDGRPLVWLDDLAGAYLRMRYWRHPDDTDKTLVITPEAHVGITAEHIAEVERFLARWS